MTEYEQTADELEERSKKLGEEITDVREDWERKRADPNVPGASPNPDTGLPPEANVTTQGDKPPESDADSREPWPDE
jgi:hypothetical protein